MTANQIQRKRKRFSVGRQKRVVIALLGILILYFYFPSPLTTFDNDYTKPSVDISQPFDKTSLSSAGSNGNNLDSVMTYSREIQDLDFSLMNTFADTASHQETLDFSQYHIAGWSLYEVLMTTSRIVAQSEREVVGTSSSPSYDYFNINETDIGDEYYNQLAQGFYNMGHDGKLENISLLYDCLYYDPSTQNYAYFDLKSDYTDGSTNMVSSVQLENVGLTDTWATITESAILDADTEYYAMINGTKLIEVFGFYPIIRWHYQDTAGSYLTRRYSTEYSAWSSNRPYEALLNYTYIPWNTTSDLALEFQNPQTIALKGNSSALSGSEWLFSSTSNVSEVQFSSNQSVLVDYNLTLRYKRNITSTTSWYAGTLGNDVTWNITSVLDFPELSGSQDKNLTLVIPSDWTANHLFNITTPAQYYDHFSQDGSSVECILLADETWILECTSPNYLQSISKFDNSDDSIINNKVLVTVTMDINSTIESPISNPATNGEASLRVFYQSTVEYAENFTVTAGKSYHSWDISAHYSSNGLHTIDIYWMNGTEVGYRTSDVLVYYETSLVADDYSIDAFTNNSFYIGIDYDQIFPVGGIDAAAADVTYSFGAVVNHTLDDQSNGRWDATVSTALMTPETYTLTVYAEGYALKNKSLTIQVSLIHDTEPLDILWSNGDNISYVETTELSIGYKRVGDIPLPTASVNVTIGAKTWQLPYDSGSETFKLTFNGTDDFPGFGNFSISIDAGLDGHESQSDNSQTFTLYREPTDMTTDWSNGRDITYIEYTTLTVNYTMSDGSPVENAWVNITIDGGTLLLHENITDGTYYLRFNGSDPILGFGEFNFTISAWKDGYVSQATTVQTLTLREVPTLFDATWLGPSTITYVESTTLSVNYTMIDGTAVIMAEVYVTIDGTQWILAWHSATQTYRKVFNGDDPLPGLGFHSLTVNATKLGHQNHTTTSLSLTIDIELTSLEIELLPSYSMNYTDFTILFVDYLMSDGVTPISDGYVTVTIGGDVREVIWNGVRYQLRIEGNDTFLVFGINSIVIQASNYGFAPASNLDYNITLSQQPTSMVIHWSNGTTPGFYDYTILGVEYTYKGGLSVLGATVNVTIDSYTWDLIWNVTTGYYELRFNGSDSNPGVGSHSLVILAGRYGFVPQSDADETLVLPDIPTTLIIEWTNGSSITYTQTTTLLVKYRMYNNSFITTAYVEVTIGAKTWILNWSDISDSYELTLDGSSNPPGFGTNQIFIDASETDFVSQFSSSNYITISQEPTSMDITWSKGNDLAYYDYTFLIVEYTYNGGLPVLNATVNVTIDTYTWDLVWNDTAQYYQIRFNGSDSNPGVGTHDLTIHAWKFGYINQYNDTKKLTLPIIPTNLIVEWTNGNSISYIQSTMLRVFYEMDINDTRISGATLNFTIDSTPYELAWNSTSGAYEYTFYGNDALPGFGVHDLTILAGKSNFVSQTDMTNSLTINYEVTSLDIIWTNGIDIGYQSNTTLSVAYLMSGGSPIYSAMVNVTIGGFFWNLTLNPMNDRYELTIYGSDVPPGFGTHEVVVSAWKYGFIEQSNSTVELTLHVEDTSFFFEWDPINSMSYVGETTLRISYLMSDGVTPIDNATVTVQITPTVWIADWNKDTKVYEVTFYGIDDRISFDTHILIIQASKTNYSSLLDTSQTLSKNEEITSIQTSWSNGNDITYSESTILYVNYTMSNGTEIPDAAVRVDTTSGGWDLAWDSDLQLYKITFTELGAWPGLGIYTLEIRCNRLGYVSILNTSSTLTITGENGQINSYWIGDGSITYIETETLVVNYTIADGTAISGAKVNVTIDGHVWDLHWHQDSETYRLTFNGTDVFPDIGSHSLRIEAWRLGFDFLPDESLTLIINEASATITVNWSNYNNITYFEHTYLFVTYAMNNGTDITGAQVNVVIGEDSWILVWNSTQGAYGVLFSGSDSPPGLGSHSLLINASVYGFEYAENIDETLTLAKDPTSIQVTWVDDINSITFVESTTLIVFYRMSNGTLIQNETLTATIGTDVFPLDWNETTEGYHYTFTGDMNPPGLGSFSVQIDASAAIFATQVTSTSLTISEEPTSAIASWPTISTTIDWTQSVVLGFDYRDNYGRLIADATQKTITIDGVPDILQGTNGTYWFEFDNSFDLGHHVVVVNISKYGYEFAVNSSISFDIVEADTDISLEWNTTTIDYLGQIILTADYTYSGTGDSILVGSVEVNITIDGVTTINLIESGDYWTITLDGDFLDLGVHSVVVRSQASGYSYAERNETLTVEEVSTITSGYTWIPANLTIDTTESLELVVYYTYSGIDVPDTAWVNVTINSRVYNLTFSTDAWRVNISGSDIWIGEFDATISAWLYGYESRTFVTPGINVTLAANTFHVIWEPFSLIPTYTDIVNLTIVYVEDSEPILDATVLLYINGTVYDLTSSYNETDKMWHFSIDAATIDLGTWNVTVTANKTGYTDGYYTDFLTVIEVSTTLDILPPEDTIYYDETTTVDIYYQLADLSAVPGAVISFTLNSVEQTIGWNVTHWSALLDGANLGIGIHTFTVSVSAYGYVDQVDTLVITILQIPTSIITDADVTIFALEFVSLRFTLIDDRTSSVVLATFAEEDWSGFLSHNLLPNGTHVITIGGSDFHVGNYTLELTLGRLGYYNSTGAIDIEALPIPTEFVYYTSWSQYENETIVIEVQLFDTAHNIPVDWAVVTIELDGTLRTAVFDATNNTYSVSFWLSPSITPGTHNLYLYGEAEDCLDAFEVTEIEILPKSTYDISITVVEQIQTGSTLNVTIIAIEGSQPVSGIYVTINIIVHLGEDTQQIITEGVVTDGDGQAIIMLDVPSGATEIEISASFQGSLSEWPSETSTYIVDVVPAGTDTGTGTGTGTSPIIADPLTLTIIAGGISLPILALAFRRRRRSGGRITAPVSVSPAAPAVPTPTAAIGIQKRVRDEIISSEEGITRAELSRRLGPSASKIGAMVKDLLNSDTGFYEVREGSKKLIKFRK